MASSSARNALRVVILDDHLAVAEALELALRTEGYDVRVVDVPDKPAPPESLVATIARLGPAVVLLNLDLGPYGGGEPLVAPLARLGTDVVVLTGLADRARWGEVLADGARTVLSKSQPLEDLLSTVRLIEQGLPVLDPVEREALVDAWMEQRSRHGEVEERINLLTSREREVLGELMMGHAVREIAARGVVSEATVRTQVKSILGKLEVSSQLAAVGMAHRIGWRVPRS